MAMEDVERDGSRQRVPQAVLLVEMGGIRAFFRIVPGTPLIHDERDFLGRIVSVHDGRMLGDIFIEAQRVRQRADPFGFWKPDGCPFVLPGGVWQRVVM